MSGLFNSLNIGTRGMTAAQTALQTTSHNLSNLNTEGYSRQRVDLQASNPYHMPGLGQLGTGVTMSGVVRVVDDYVTKQIQQETSSFKKYETKSDTLAQLEMIFNEPSKAGLSEGFNRFYSTWNYLGANPELATAKTMVSQEAQTLTDTLSSMSKQIEGLKGDTTYAIEKDVLDFNSKVDQLNTLNKQIFNVVVKGHTPNDLLDQRDRLTTELAGIVDADFSYDKFQRVSIKVAGNDILNENSSQKLVNLPDGQVGLANTNQPITVTNGSIKGSQEALQVITDKGKELDQMTYTFASAVNKIHSDGGKGMDFFTVSPTDSAKSLKVNKDIIADPSKINAGSSLAKPVSGDGSRATAISSLATTSLLYFNGGLSNDYDADKMSFISKPGGTTTDGAYNNMITSMGIIKEQADHMTTSQGEVVGFLEDRRSSISGVNMNEEVVDMMKFQSAFQANARIISMVDEMLDTLINRTGV